MLIAEKRLSLPLPSEPTLPGTSKRFSNDPPLNDEENNEKLAELMSQPQEQNVPFIPSQCPSPSGNLSPQKMMPACCSSSKEWRPL
jgi:hypothetical protein